MVSPPLELGFVLTALNPAGTDLSSTELIFIDVTG
jgi:hypothetical protein